MNHKKNLKIIFTIIYLVVSVSLFAQNNSCVPDDVSQSMKEKAERILQQNGTRNQYVQKNIRFNIHFMLKTNGTGNFNEINDGLGNSTNGYSIAYDIFNHMKGKSNWNELTLNGNVFPGLPAVVDKKYNYILDAVYFHRDDDNFSMFKAIQYDFPYEEDENEVINVYFSHAAGTTIRGQAYGGSNQTDIGSIYSRYTKLITIPSGDTYEGFIHASAFTVMHEIGHLQGLPHTVYVSSTGTKCPVDNPGCDDGILDTPTAYDIVHYPACGLHPAFAWQSSYPCNTKNIMDYQGGNALTPMQLVVMHNYMEDTSELKYYNLCSAVDTNTTIDALAFPKISYYGKEVDVKSSTTGGSVVLAGNEPADIYFSSDVEFFPMEVKGTTNYKSKMEVFHFAICSF
jgi:hypothetical protein